MKLESEGFSYWSSVDVQGSAENETGTRKLDTKFLLVYPSIYYLSLKQMQAGTPDG